MPMYSSMSGLRSLALRRAFASLFSSLQLPVGFQKSGEDCLLVDFAHVLMWEILSALSLEQLFYKHVMMNGNGFLSS